MALESGLHFVITVLQFKIVLKTMSFKAIKIHLKEMISYVIL